MPDQYIDVASAMPLTTTTALADGRIAIIGDHVYLGTRPLTTREAAAREARLIVRRGLADVLEWLGEPVEIYPTSAEILERFQAMNDARKGNQS
jgi:hypothetical protein